MSQFRDSPKSNDFVKFFYAEDIAGPIDNCPPDLLLKRLWLVSKHLKSAADFAQSRSSLLPEKINRVEERFHLKSILSTKLGDALAALVGEWDDELGGPKERLST